jgi:hypothetical protein
MAASVIDRYLDGDGTLDERLVDEVPLTPALGPADGFAQRARAATPWAADQSCAEADRCLQCDLRLSMARVRFWGDY